MDKSYETKSNLYDNFDQNIFLTLCNNQNDFFDR